MMGKQTKGCDYTHPTHLYQCRVQNDGFCPSGGEGIKASNFNYTASQLSIVHKSRHRDLLLKTKALLYGLLEGIFKEGEQRDVPHHHLQIWATGAEDSDPSDPQAGSQAFWTATRQAFSYEPHCSLRNFTPLEMHPRYQVFQDTFPSVSPKYISSGPSFWKTKMEVN